jgi:hypothetical protein
MFLGVPHLNMEDDVYGEYFIPKDSIVISNLWYVFKRCDTSSPADEWYLHLQGYASE